MDNTTLADPAAWTPNYGGQTDFAFDDLHRYVALAGGWGSGKTWIGARKLIRLHAYNAFDDAGNPTFVPSAVVAPTYQNAMDYDVPAIQDALADLGLSYTWRGSGSLCGGRFSGPAIIIPDWGTRDHPSVILFRTADAPERITGWEVGAGWGDEPSRWPRNDDDPKRDPFIQFMGRVRHPKARRCQMLFTFTHEGQGTRVFKEFSGTDLEHIIYTAPTKQNPHVATFQESLRGVLDPRLAQQYLDGIALNLRGMPVYPYFSQEPGRNVDPTIMLDRSLPLHLRMDFNSAPGMHALIGQYDEKRDLFTSWWEFFEDGLTIRRLLADMLPRMFLEQSIVKDGRFTFPELHVFGDASGGSRNPGHAETNWDYVVQGLQALQLPFKLRVPRGNPFVEDRINAVNAALCDLSGTVHWKCHPRCQRLINDLSTMVRDKDGCIDKRDINLSHASDADGYAIWYLRPIHRRYFEPQRTNV